MELIVKAGEHEERLRVERAGDSDQGQDSGYTVQVGDRSYRIDARKVPGDDLWSILLDGAQHAVAVATQSGGVYSVTVAGGTSLQVEVADPLTFLARQGEIGKGARGAGRVVAYMPGRVVALLVQAGDQVEPGQGLLVLEAMKMQNEIQAERAGSIKRVCVAEGQAVDGGELLFELEG